MVNPREVKFMLENVKGLKIHGRCFNDEANLILSRTLMIEFPLYMERTEVEKAPFQKDYLLLLIILFQLI